MNGRDPYEEAADWLDDADSWDHARRAGFLDWLVRDPAHVEAARAVARVMDDPAATQALQALPAFPANDIETPGRRHGRGRKAAAMAAGVAALALGLGAGWGAWRLTPVAPPPQHFATGLGQDMASHLSDGSVLHLDPATTLDVRMSPGARRLHLAQGRALFEVAHAPERPFTVESGPMAVTAIGTVFSVDNSPAGQGLRVEQGRVRVVIEGLEQPLMVGAGQGLMLDRADHVLRFTFRPDPVQAADPQWLVADHERLDALVARLQRHSAAPLVLSPQLAGEPISGRYRSHDPLGSLRLIALAHGWRVMPDGAGWRMTP
ncbi:FecR family protein [Novosphingobium humi]|uniref:FecR domain-containing protein n=1 Tax=Novosphingobium humi TaxID=2282397 RepID=A0ABY7U1M7_9SPHN|nr:FecR domain-containing protein [Novosphingobium humi]WCT79414.1 FecR domain-containing protein [Novosphingobium humi]WJT00593.1 FecR domain-containing protein [Novosphingobium humi]